MQFHVMLDYYMQDVYVWLGFCYEYDRRGLMLFVKRIKMKQRFHIPILIGVNEDGLPLVTGFLRSLIWLGFDRALIYLGGPIKIWLWHLCEKVLAFWPLWPFMMIGSWDRFWSFPVPRVWYVRESYVLIISTERRFLWFVWSRRPLWFCVLCTECVIWKPWLSFKHFKIKVIMCFFQHFFIITKNFNALFIKNNLSLCKQAEKVKMMSTFNKRYFH